MIRTKPYTKAYIVTRSGRLLSELSGFSLEDMSGLRAILPFLSNGDILRCFTQIGFVDTYIIKLIENSNWPTIIRLEDITEQKKVG